MGKKCSVDPAVVMIIHGKSCRPWQDENYSTTIAKVSGLALCKSHYWNKEAWFLDENVATSTLIAVDNPDKFRALSQMLMDVGYDVRVTTNGEMVLKTLRL